MQIGNHRITVVFEKSVPRMSHSDRFTVIRAATRIWVIAAIHGDLDRLVAVHDEIAMDIKPGDRIVYTGNYFGYGTDLPAVLDELLRFRAWFLSHPPYQHSDDIIYLRGAQEEMWGKLMQLQFAPNPAAVLEWIGARGLREMIEAIGLSFEEGIAKAHEGTLAMTHWTNRVRETGRLLPGHDALMASLKRAAYTDDGLILFVHTGIDPEKALSRQSDSFWWASQSFKALNEPYRGFHRVFRGFDPEAQGLLESEFTVSIDGGCGRGGSLYAIRILSNGEIDQRIAA